MSNVFKINLEEVFYDFDLGFIKLRFNRTDDNILKLRRDFKELSKELKAIEKEYQKEDEMTEEDFNKAKAFLKKAWDASFEGETFDIVYKERPSIVVLVNAFSNIYYHIEENLKVEEIKNKQEKAQQYVKNKKRK